jgi:hypothetical protein
MRWYRAAHTWAFDLIELNGASKRAEAPVCASNRFVKILLFTPARGFHAGDNCVIIWQGRGGITALIIVLSIVVVLVLINLTGWHGPDWATYFAMAVPAAAANAILVANSPSAERVLIDKQTGHEFTVSSRHTLFWIPINIGRSSFLCTP